ncbi:GntR family transcriptional regulator [Clostridia bacterium]|nr:GntR family transcriptional regulator [Clostridia bacterium]
MASDYKYNVIKIWIEGKIKSGHYKTGDRLPSEQALCNKFNFSRQTVRNAIIKLTEAGVVRSVQGSGTYVADSQNILREKRVGVIFSYMQDYIFPSILRGVESGLMKAGYGIEFGITGNSIEKERQILERMLTSNLSGFIVEGSCSALPNPNIEIYRRLKKMGIPVVFIHNYYEEHLFPSIMTRDAECTKLLTEVLIDEGHTKIAGLFKIDDFQGRSRLGGYLEALYDADIPVEEKDIFYYTTRTADITRIPGLMDTFTGSDPCTAIVCYNDQVARILYGLFLNTGLKVPDDVSMTGFDNVFETMLDGVRLTTIKHPKGELGKRAVQCLLEMIEKGVDCIPANPNYMDSEMAVGNSIGKAPHQAEIA